jgi:hypothetical protein
VANISKSITLFEKRLQTTFSQLERKVSDISILKELSDLGVALLHFQKLSRYFVFVSFRKS